MQQVREIPPLLVTPYLSPPVRSECELELDQYSSLSQFFTRRLKPNLRPISEGSLVVSPADGTITNSAPLKVRIDFIPALQPC